MSDRYLVRTEAFFEAAHNLRSYHGKPEPLHGHSWKVEVEVEADGLDSEGMAVDFVQVTSALTGVVKKLDYTYLNEVPPFTDLAPTAENIAAWICRELAGPVGRQGGKVHEVRVFEGRHASAAYRPAAV
ncbi:MAG: 6-carboxytetrahydropterin synthase [Pseudomonadota bacterium]